METETYKKFKNKPQDNSPVFIAVHHSGGTDANPLEDTSHHTAQIMETHHISLGWEGLGYHYVIHKNGEVWKGRPEHYHGAHISGKDTDGVKFNDKSIGICLAGNFDATLPTREQENALAGLIASIRGRYPCITQDKIYPHRKFANKTCYGRNLTDDWAKNLISFPPITPKGIILKRLAEITKMVEELEVI